MERLRMEALVEAVVEWTRYRTDAPRVFTWNLQLESQPQLMVGTADGIKRIVLNESRLRRYARTFDFERACRWVLKAIREAPAA